MEANKISPSSSPDLLNHVDNHHHSGEYREEEKMNPQDYYHSKVNARNKMVSSSLRARKSTRFIFVMLLILIFLNLTFLSLYILQSKRESTSPTNNNSVLFYVYTFISVPSQIQQHWQQNQDVVLATDEEQGRQQLKNLLLQRKEEIKLEKLNPLELKQKTDSVVPADVKKKQRVSSRMATNGKKLINDVEEIITPQEQKLYGQRMWSRTELIQLLDSPQCSASIKRARMRHPRNVAICPLCTRGFIDPETFTSARIRKKSDQAIEPVPIQYMKIPKAGSSSMVRFLTNNSQANEKQSRVLCKHRKESALSELRYTVIRNPLERVVSAYHEVDYYRKNWEHSPNISYTRYDRVKKRTKRFLYFLRDYFDGYMQSWDAGMAHHMVSAALHLDTIRTLPNGTINNDLLPGLVGRLEHVDEFMSFLRTVVASKVIPANVSTASGITYNSSNLKKRYVKNSGKKILPGTEWVIQKLFEEDFVCFGYDLLEHDQDHRHLDKKIATEVSETENKTLSQRYLDNKIATEISKTENTTLSNKRFAIGLRISHPIFPQAILEKYELNYLKANVVVPNCEDHYNSLLAFPIKPSWTEVNKNSNELNSDTGMPTTKISPNARKSNLETPASAKKARIVMKKNKNGDIISKTIIDANNNILSRVVMKENLRKAIEFSQNISLEKFLNYKSKRQNRHTFHNN